MHDKGHTPKEHLEKLGFDGVEGFMSSWDTKVLFYAIQELMGKVEKLEGEVKKLKKSRK